MSVESLLACSTCGEPTLPTADGELCEGGHLSAKPVRATFPCGTYWKLRQRFIQGDIRFLDDRLKVKRRGR